MATSILELGINTGKWDAGIKKAQQTLTAFINEQGGVQNALEKDNERMTAFVTMMGKMDSSATTSKGQLRDLTQTLTELTRIYRSLNDEQKNSDFGKTLSQSMEDLTKRAGAIRDAMEDVERSVKGESSDTRTFDQLAGAASTATSVFQTFTGTAKVLGIELGNDVQVIAKLQAAMAVTNGLTTIQTQLQKESALMRGIQTVQEKAYAAAQALSTKNTVAATVAQKALNAVAKANPYVLLASAIAGAATAFGLFSSGAKDAGSETVVLTGELKAAADALEDIGAKANFDIAIAQAAGKSVEAIRDMRIAAEAEMIQMAKTAAEQARQMGMAAAENLDFKGMAQAEQAFQNAAETWAKSQNNKYNLEQEKAQQAATDAYIQNNWRSFNTRSSIQSAISYFTGRQSQVKVGSQEDKEIQEIIRQLNSRLPKTVNVTVGGGSGRNTTIEKETFAEGTLGAYLRDIAALKNDQQLATTNAEWQNIQSLINELTVLAKEITGELKTEPLGLDSIQETATKDIQKAQNRLNDPKIIQDGMKSLTAKVDASLQKSDVNITELTGQISGSLGQMVSGLNAIGIEVPAEIEKVVTILSGISTILTAIQTISAIKFWSNGGVVHAASGMVVPGTAYGYDGIPSLLTSGELVLNRAQQNVLASQLNGGFGNIELHATLAGEDIFLSSNRVNRRRGYGEILTSKRIR